MKAWALLRALAWLKRGVLALESIAESQRALVSPQRTKAPKMGEVFTPSVEERNEAWQERSAFGPDY